MYVTCFPVTSLVNYSSIHERNLANDKLLLPKRAYACQSYNLCCVSIDCLKKYTAVNNAKYFYSAVCLTEKIYLCDTCGQGCWPPAELKSNLCFAVY